MMRVHRSSLAASVLAMACLSASPASSGLPSDPPRSAPGKLPSGEIPPAPTGAGEIRIAPLASRPGGRTYGRWVAAWTRWAVQTRAAAHPLLGTTADCRTDQQGKVSTAERFRSAGRGKFPSLEASSAAVRAPLAWAAQVGS
jgi:hypothetical protein